MKKQQQYSFLRVLGRLVPMVCKAIPVFLLVESVLSAGNAAYQAITPYLSQRLFDAVQAAIGQSQPQWSAVISALMLLGVVTVVGQFVNGTFHIVGRTLVIRMQGIFLKMAHDKAARIDPVSFEVPETFDAINKAKEGAEHATNFVFRLVLVLTYHLVNVGIMGAYLYSLKPILAIAVVIAFVPALTSLWVRSSVFGKLEDRVAPIRRKYEYFERTIADREYFKETRILGALSYFRGLYLAAMSALSREQGKAERKVNAIELGLNVVSLLGYLGVLALLVQALLAGDIGAGAFAAVFASVGMVSGTIHYMINDHFGTMSKNMGALRNFLRFLDMPERQGTTVPIAGAGGVVLLDAAFRYPSSDRDALTHIDLTVAAGETIAIVGPNGAGKTTLVRLMTGLYLPTAGSVQLRGVETAEIDPAVLYEGMTAVFQKYQRYQLKLGENVTISDTTISHQDVKIAQALQKADLSPQDGAFVTGLDTMLSREFDGVDLSGGQWQRVAIARGLYRVHDFIVLDEPTASIDPLEEQRIYQKFTELSADKTAIIVTHRLGSTRLAHRIVVMSEGGIEAVGNHQELLHTCPMYEQMWAAQAQWYQAEEAG